MSKDRVVDSLGRIDDDMIQRGSFASEKEASRLDEMGCNGGVLLPANCGSGCGSQPIPGDHTGSTEQQ